MSGRSAYLAINLAFGLSLVLSACGPAPETLTELRARGELRVATVNEPTAYYLGAHGPQGLEYRLARAFADSLRVQLIIVPTHDRASLRQLLAAGSADIAAAQLTADSSWKQVGLATEPYMEVPQLVVQRRGHPATHNIAQLNGTRLVVRDGSPQLQLLRELRGSGADYLAWTELSRDQADPLDWVTSGDADFAIVDRSEFAFAHHLYPEVSVAFALPDPRPVQWVVRRGAPELRNAANRFFAATHASGVLPKLLQAAAAEAGEFEYQQARRFQDDISARLPSLRGIFEQAATATKVDWRLLAAMGYQESHWSDSATSGDDAAGIMMLTEDTAKAMGVRDRRNTLQNIQGGAAYFDQLRSQVPAHVAEPDHTWLALAAYNVGFGHLEDARILAQAQGKNPDSWDDVSHYLTWLAEPRWYTQARRGYARGWEPVQFVAEVRQFLAVLEWYDGVHPTPTARASALNAAAQKTPLTVRRTPLGGGRRTHRRGD